MCRSNILFKQIADMSPTKHNDGDSGMGLPRKRESDSYRHQVKFFLLHYIKNKSICLLNISCKHDFFVYLFVITLFSDSLRLTIYSFLYIFFTQVFLYIYCAFYYRFYYLFDLLSVLEYGSLFTICFLYVYCVYCKINKEK